VSAGGSVDNRMRRDKIDPMTGPQRGERRRAGPSSTRWSIERVLGNDVASLVAVTAELERLLAAQGVPAEVVYGCSLALEEVFTNILRHAHADAGAHEVRFGARLTAEHAVLDFVDDGREFDPLAAPPPDLRRPPEERPIGGLGIHLVRELADRLEYERAGGLNHLTIHFALRPQE